MDIQKFINHVSEWGNAEKEITSIIVIGSYAREIKTDATNIEIGILTENITYFTEDVSFVQQFGAVSKVEKVKWGTVMSIHVWYEDGLEVDFGIANKDWMTNPLAEETKRILNQGYKVLMDKEQLFKRID